MLPAKSLATLCASLLCVQTAVAQTSVLGGTLAAPVDITAQVLSDTNIQLNGGYFIVTVPVAGTAGTTPAAQLTGLSSTLVSYGAGHFVGATAPTIYYTGVLSGTGTLTVSNATNATANPASGATFDGGVLLFTKAQTFTNPGAVSLIISPNTTVAFDLGGSLGTYGTFQANVTNNGYLYSWNKGSNGTQNAWCSIAPTLTGAGVTTFESGNILSNGCSFSGAVYDMNGAHIHQQGTFPDPSTKVVQSNIFVFETQGDNYLTDEAGITFRSFFNGDYYSFGADTQITGKGIEVFTGLMLSADGNTKKDFLPPEQSRLFDFFDHGFGGFGVPIYIQATMQMGNGEAIVNYTDTNNGNTYVTNNTFLQTNIAASIIETGQFEHTPTSEAEALYNQAIGFDYSGTYSYDAGANVGINSQGQISGTPEYGNLIVVNADPQNTGKAPNHLVLTAPLLMHGITQIDANTILQLGDGTVGNSEARTLIIGTTSYPGTYSTSYGNGVILTATNAPSTSLNTAFDEIIDNGQLIVDNVPGAADLVQADTSLATTMQANELDTIIGSGSLEQKGSLALTLSGVNTFSGGTTVDRGATLLVASPTALGSLGSSGLSSAGQVINNGVLQATGSNHVITVPGDFSQF
jgi:autotransporter-associated beta strand protein